MSVRALHDEADLEAAQQFKRQLSDALATEQPTLRVPAIAHQLRVSRTRLYKYLDARELAHNMPWYLDQLWTAQVGPQLLRERAYAAGYLLVPLPDPGSDPQTIVDLASTLLTQLGTVLQHTSTGLPKGEYPYALQREIRAGVQRSISTLVQLERATCRSHPAAVWVA